MQTICQYILDCTLEIYKYIYIYMKLHKIMLNPKPTELPSNHIVKQESAAWNNYINFLCETVGLNKDEIQRAKKLRDQVYKPAVFYAS